MKNYEYYIDLKNKFEKKGVETNCEFLCNLCKKWAYECEQKAMELYER